MSWMTKGGSSSALGQSPLRFPLNELAQRHVASTARDAIATRLGCGVDDRCGSPASHTTKGADTCGTGRAAGTPPDEGGFYRSEGFG
jgi:hypothetical protein